jgi:hypothetical protein
MPDRDKGYQRGGASGIEGDLGDDTIAPDEPEESEGSQEQADLPSTRPPPDTMGKSGFDQGQQRGGLRREPDLEGAEQKTGHEVD